MSFPPAISAIQEPVEGVVLCAVGPAYVRMAEGVRASLAACDPGLPVDLFTDAAAEVSGAFARVVRLEAPWRRSKIDAMIATRFARTLFLDVDLFALATVGEMFDVLSRFDIAAAQDAERNTHHANAIWRKALPATFPQLNTGVIAYRRSAEVLDFLAAWRDAVRDHDMGRDQPAFRELLWDSDLRVATLPPEFNFTAPGELPFFQNSYGAPRILHYYRIRSAKAAPGRTPELADVLGPGTRAILAGMGAADFALAARAGRPAVRVGGLRKRGLQLRALLEQGLARLSGRDAVVKAPAANSRKAR